MTHPVESLSASMVRRLLERGVDVARKSAANASRFAEARSSLRECLKDHIHPVDDAELSSIPSPSIAAIDGALVCDSRSLGDICAAVGVSVGPAQGQTDSDVWMDSVSRAPKNKEVLAGIMSSMEIELAARSTADVVMIDGSLLSTLINVSNGLFATRNNGSSISERLRASKSQEFRDRVMSVLLSSRHIAMAKYTTANEFASELPEDFQAHDGRTVFTMALRPGEMSAFAFRSSDASSDTKRQLIAPALGFEMKDSDFFAAAVNGVVSCYYRPHPWTPAFRIDMTAAAFGDAEAQIRALRAVRDSTLSGGIREPAPLYLADRLAKQVSVGVSPVVEMSVLNATDDPDAKLLLAMGYRT